MKRSNRSVAYLASALVLSLLITSFGGIAAFAESATAQANPSVRSVHPGNFDVYDYFEDVYGLTADKAYEKDGTPYFYRSYLQKTVNERGLTRNVYHPYSTLLFEEFQYLLQSQNEGDLGYYAIVFGGEWEENTAAVLENVNLAAGALAEANNQYTTDKNGNQVKLDDQFVNTIYSFDFKLSGGLAIEERLEAYGFTPADSEYDTDIRADQTGYGSGEKRVTVTNLYKTLYDTLNVTDAAPEFVSGKTVSVKGGETLSTDVAELNFINSPSVLLIRKEDIDPSDAVEIKNTVVDYVDASAIDFTDASQAEAFRAKVGELLAKAPEGLQSFDFFRYIWGSFTQEFASSFTGQNLNIQYDNLTDPGHVFKTVTYRELVHILESDGNYALYFGGAWCPYSKGFLAPLNQVAKSYDVTAIYVYDPRIDGVGSNTMIRAAESGSGLFQRLYANLMTYFGVDYNSFSFPSSHDYLSNKLGIPDEDIEIAGKKLTKIGVPTFIGYNKDNLDLYGEPAAIVGTASTADTYANIVAESTEPFKYASERTVAEPKPEYLYYEHAAYVEVLRTSLSGRRQESNIIRFLDGFYEGKLTFAPKA
ncbi:MAG TPA: hypothetical protein PKE04_00550, partial [Clostridia bacterium]|nr:hypothetical protein [Clostridia bacterium]